MNNTDYSASLVRYAILLRYTSLQSYRMLQQEFSLPSLSHSRKITQGSIDSYKASKLLLDKGCISADVLLVFDNMFLEKGEDYVNRHLYGSNASGELYECVMCFMIIGQQNNVPTVIKTVPVTKLDSSWLKVELGNQLLLLDEFNFKVEDWVINLWDSMQLIHYICIIINPWFS